MSVSSPISVRNRKENMEHATQSLQTLWPCRVAECEKVPCPKCGRFMQAKRLQYAHVCKGTPGERAQSMRSRAVAGFEKRAEQGGSICQKSSQAPELMKQFDLAVGGSRMSLH